MSVCRTRAPGRLADGETGLVGGVTIAEQAVVVRGSSRGRLSATRGRIPVHTEVYFPFLDEAPEFDRRVLDALRQPLESGTVTIARAQSVAHYPAHFQLVLAANPCACGNAGGTDQACTCTAVQRRRYFGKLSGPLLDRVDLQLRVPAVTYHELSGGHGRAPEDSAAVAERVATARDAQEERLRRWGCRLNSAVPGSLLHRTLSPGTRSVLPLKAAMDNKTLTARGFVKVLRVAWTLADLAGATVPSPEHVQLALYFKTTVTT